MHMDEHKALRAENADPKSSVCVFVCLTLSVHPELW